MKHIFQNARGPNMEFKEQFKYKITNLERGRFQKPTKYKIVINHTPKFYVKGKDK